ncbi:MAG: DNRLRE domain-containing protein [Thermodesulfobacteriota bacterium]|nr:DNRLRE domain-containing protein [Thermodesulfobacteriota bacterium]
MKERVISGLVLLLVLGLLVCPQLKAAPVTVTAIADSYVYSDAPDTNYGSNTYLFAMGGNPDYCGYGQTGDGNNPAARSYLKFDLGDIPDSATITSAQLDLKHAAGTAYTMGGHWQVHYVSDDSWTEGDITWANRPLQSPNQNEAPCPDSNCSDTLLDYVGAYGYPAT